MKSGWTGRDGFELGDIHQIKSNDNFRDASYVNGRYITKDAGCVGWLAKSMVEGPDVSGYLEQNKNFQ